MDFENISLFYHDPAIAAHGASVALDFSSPGAAWETLHKHYQPFYIYLFFYTTMWFLFAAVGVFFIFIEHSEWLEKDKIHKNYPKHTREDYWKVFMNLVLNFVCLLPAIVPGWPALNWLGLPWNTGAAGFPTLYELTWQMIFCLIVEDFVQYFLHGLLHTKFLYQNVHKIHHEYNVVFAFAGIYAHPVETFFLGIATFAPILILRPHMFTFYLWVCLRWMDAAFEHSDYLIPGYKFLADWVPFYGGIAFHTTHHAGFSCNYASRFTYLDKLFGTYSHPRTDTVNESDVYGPSKKTQ